MNVTCFAFPPTHPGRATWAANPTCRGTFEIITLCLSTTIICIWSSIHNDIPVTRPPQPSDKDSDSDGLIECIRRAANGAMCWLRQRLSDFLRILRNTGPTVVVAFFCPALLLLRAIDQYSSARKLRDLAKEKKPDTTVRSYYPPLAEYHTYIALLVHHCPRVLRDNGGFPA